MAKEKVRRKSGHRDMPSMTPQHFMELRAWLESMREAFVEGARVSYAMYRHTKTESLKKQFNYNKTCISCCDFILAHLRLEEQRHGLTDHTNGPDPT